MLIARERSRISQPEIRQRSQSHDYKVKSNAVSNFSHRLFKDFCLLNLIEFAKYNLSFVYALYQSFLSALGYFALRFTRSIFLFLHFYTCSVQTIVDFLEDTESSSATLYDFAFQQFRISLCGELYPRRQSLSSN